VHVWRIEDGRQLATKTAHEGPANACAVADARTLLTFGADGAVRRWSLPDLNPEGVVAEGAGHLTFAAVSGDGSMLAFGSRDGDISGVVRLRRSDGRQAGTGDLEVDGPVLCCALGHTAESLLTGLADGRLVWWNPTTGDRRTVQAHDGEVYDCAVTPDGGLAASAEDDATLRLWRLPELTPVATLLGHQYLVSGCSFDASGHLLLSAGGDDTACLWDVPAAQGASHGGHSGLVWSCGFSSDGAEFVTASSDGTVRRWDARSGLETGEPVHHPGVVAELTRSADRWVLAAGDEGLVTTFRQAWSGTAQPGQVIGSHGPRRL
jgi:NACHT domain- and WD repeat-containing protein